MKSYFIFIYHLNVHPTSSGMFCNFKITTIVMATIEVLIKIFCVFVALLLGATTTNLVIACTIWGNICVDWMV